MCRAALALSFLWLAFAGCGDDGAEAPDAAVDRADADTAPDAGQLCPNAIASDENCMCLKDFGSGASYCAASCALDAECAGMTSGWGTVPLVCHPEGYCTRACTDALDCSLGDGVEYACDDGRCTVCIGCI